MWTFLSATQLARLPADLAWGQAWQQAQLPLRLLQGWPQPDAAGPDPWLRWLGDSAARASALPFDLLRLQHAAAVLAGVWPRSLLESTRFERQLGDLQRLALGPLAPRD